MRDEYTLISPLCSSSDLFLCRSNAHREKIKECTMHFQLLAASLLAVNVLSQSVCTSTVDIGFSPTVVQAIATSKAKSNWEWGTNAQALLELYDPDVSVNAFPGGKIPKKKTTATIRKEQDRDVREHLDSKRR